MVSPASEANGLLGLWTRWVENRPQVTLIADPIFGVGRRYLYFVVSNPTKAIIRVTSITIAPDFFGIWKDDSTEAAAEAWSGIAASAFIEPGTERRFPVELVNNLSDENRKISCKITVYWRSMRHQNIPCIPVTYRTQVAALEAQLEDKA